MITRTQAIKAFLSKNTHFDLASLYNHDMECQVNVRQDGGNRVEGDYKGRQWNAWTDGIQIWKPFRIPYNAGTNPEYQDVPMSYDLGEHAEGIGMTGWDWVNKISRWVAFDFDALIGHSIRHSKKLSTEELRNIEEQVKQVSWVTLRKSTSGKGLHLYVFLDLISKDIKTNNHFEHAALARSILDKLSILCNYNFLSKVDTLGGNMWVWHKKMSNPDNKDGLVLLKQGDILSDIPPNWKEYLTVVTGKRQKSLPAFLSNKDNQNRPEIISSFQQLASQQSLVELDEEHKRLINYLEESKACWWWNADYGMLITHTIHLQEAHQKLGFKGMFRTVAKGEDYGRDHNCYLFPLRNGAWSVRRYTKGAIEDPLWFQDGQGWTRCFFNKELDLPTAAKAFGGIEDAGNIFVFETAERAREAAKILGAEYELPDWISKRQCRMKINKGDQRLVVEIDWMAQDVNSRPPLDNWVLSKKIWRRIFDVKTLHRGDKDELPNYDDVIRHLVSIKNEDCGWAICSEGIWKNERYQHIFPAIESLGHTAKEVKAIVGSCVFQPWQIVNLPFKPEYPGGRQWNRNGAQFRFIPNLNQEIRTYPTWSKILNHCGKGINDDIQHNEWCKINGILNGADYLKCWIASLFQYPMRPLPYLFFHGPEKCGKSTFHEAISLLLTTGVVRADHCLDSKTTFNGELEGALLCVIEETDFRKDRVASNKIKDWVTSTNLSIHAKRLTPYQVPNSCHFTQCNNSHLACPIFKGDTRITMIKVDMPDQLISKEELNTLLQKEAPDFLAEIITLELPVSSDPRLNIPVIETQDKMIVQESNQSILEQFLNLYCYNIPGQVIRFGEFYNKFIEYVEKESSGEFGQWSKNKVSRELPIHYPTGMFNNETHIGNISWTKNATPGLKMYRSFDTLEYMKDSKDSKDIKVI